MSGEEIDDRLSKRFGDDDDDEANEATEDTNSKIDSRSKTSQNAQNNKKAQNVKKEWNVRSFYLNDDLDSSLTTAFKRLDLDIDETDSDINLQKTRHFYPLIVKLGLERLEELEVTEVTERIEE